MTIKNDAKGFLLMDCIIAIFIAVIALAALSVMYSSGAENLGNAEIRGKQVMLLRGQASILSAADGVASKTDLMGASGSDGLIGEINEAASSNNKWNLGEIELDGVKYYTKAADVSSSTSSSNSYNIYSSTESQPTIYSVLLTCDNTADKDGSGNLKKTPHYLETRVYVTLKDETSGTSTGGNNENNQNGDNGNSQSGNNNQENNNQGNGNQGNGNQGNGNQGGGQGQGTGQPGGRGGW